MSSLNCDDGAGELEAGDKVKTPPRAESRSSEIPLLDKESSPPNSATVKTDQSRYETITLEELRLREWEEIAKRRTEPKTADGGRSAQSSPSVGPPQDLVGLALSGGGVRSSMFNTGVLQGLEGIGLLKHVDYLATVSGGGFIGGFLTSQYQKRQGRFMLGENPGGGQSPAVNQLTRSGDYLKNPLELTLRVATGMVLHLLIIASILILSCSALSWLWRAPDMSQLQRLFATQAMRLDGSPGLRSLVVFYFASTICLLYNSSGLFHSLSRPRSRGNQNRFIDKAWGFRGFNSRKILTWVAILVSSLFFIWYEGGLFPIYRDWFAMSDFVRAFLPLGILAYLLGLLNQASKRPIRETVWGVLVVLSLSLLVYKIGVMAVFGEWFIVSNPFLLFILMAPALLAHLHARLARALGPTVGSAARRFATAPFFALLIPSILFFLHEVILMATYGGRITPSTLALILALLAQSLYIYKLMTSEWTEERPLDDDARSGSPAPWKSPLARLARYRNPVLVVGFALAILTLFANGDIDLGPRIGHVARRLLPSLGQEAKAAAGQVSVQVRNNQSIRQWISTVTQYLVFIQLASGVIPLILPRQFASSAQAGAGGFSRSVYRGIIFLLFISLPLIICFIFLRENICGSVQVPSPIKRLAVSRDPTTGMYGYLIDHDQWTRFRWFLAGVWGFLALNWLVDLNQTSLHKYYRRRLKDAYFDAFPSQDAEPSDPDELKETRLVEIKVGETGAPYPLLVATLNESRPGSISVDSGCAFIFSPLYCGWSRNQPIGPLMWEDRKEWSEDPPGHRSCFIKTEAYGAPTEGESGPTPRGLRLVDAMAISGAAITPTSSHSLLDTLLLLAVNARLGQWMVNPEVGTSDAQEPNNEASVSRREEVFERLLGARGRGIPTVSAWGLLTSLLKSPGGERELCFLSDGAHYDNLGMETLFERRCRLIIASDASHDPQYEFKDLSKTLRRLRAFWGIEFFLDRESVEKKGEDAGMRLIPADFDLLSLKDFLRDDGAGSKAESAKWSPLSSSGSSADGKSGSKKEGGKLSVCRSRHLVFVFRYPDGMRLPESQRWGLLIVLKPALDGREDRLSPGLFSFAQSHKTFPMDGDMNQFFDENQCEYYRELGELVARSILRNGVGADCSLDEIMRHVNRPRADGREPAPREMGFNGQLGAPRAEVGNERA